MAEKEYKLDTEKNIIETQNLSFYYSNDDEEYENENNDFQKNDKSEDVQLILKGIDLKIKKGEFVAVLGHNGSGKSTLAKHFSTILLPTGGKVYVNGVDTLDSEKSYEIRQNVGMVFQNPDNQLVATVVEEDVAFAPENLGIPMPMLRERVDNALRAVDMYDFREHSANQLSGGQKQRVAIAGVIAMEPECIVLDEPTAMLDPKGRQEVIDTIRKLNKEKNITIVLITHFMNEAARADRVVIIDEGKLLLSGTPHEVFMNVGLLQSVGLDVPQATELMFALRQEDIKLPLEILTTDECIDALVDYLEAK